VWPANHLSSRPPKEPICGGALHALCAEKLRMCRTPDLAPPPCVHCGNCRHCGQAYAGEEGALASEAPVHVHDREEGESSEGGGASAANAQASKTPSQECRRPHKKPPWMSPNRLPLISPGAGVYADPDEDGKWMFLNNAPYGRHSRHMHTQATNLAARVLASSCATERRPQLALSRRPPAT
jgi:hypothetical protein